MRDVDWVHWGAETLESGPGTGLLRGDERAGAGTAQGRVGDLWGFRVRGAGQPKVFASPHLLQRFLLLQRRKWKPEVLTAPSGVSEVAELEHPVPASLT